MNHSYHEHHFNQNPGFNLNPQYHNHPYHNPVIINQSGGIPFVAGVATGSLLSPHANATPYPPYPYMPYPQSYPPYPQPYPYPQNPYQSLNQNYQ